MAPHSSNLCCSWVSSNCFCVKMIEGGPEPKHSFSARGGEQLELWPCWGLALTHSPVWRQHHPPPPTGSLSLPRAAPDKLGDFQGLLRRRDTYSGGDSRWLPCLCLLPRDTPLLSPLHGSWAFTLPLCPCKTPHLPRIYLLFIPYSKLRAMCPLSQGEFCVSFLSQLNSQ